MITGNDFEKLATVVLENIAKLQALPDYARTDEQRATEAQVKTDLIMAIAPLLINVARSLNEIAFYVSEISRGMQQR